MNKITKTTCAICTSPVLFHNPDQGTCFYRPLYKEEDVRDLLKLVKAQQAELEEIGRKLLTLPSLRTAKEEEGKREIVDQILNRKNKDIKALVEAARKGHESINGEVNCCDDGKCSFATALEPFKNYWEKT